ncbi:E3 ubiquitin-protein ligase RNF13-like isoform X2 [Brevipalpus obovatus]|uniref:E3 ubiquitin-protein ligase RNF13-like isoform X2 n=1 Tax=Brevipalpus obovatus TaxID=246614 RepID=UPI003D9E2E88
MDFHESNSMLIRVLVFLSINIILLVSGDIQIKNNQNKTVKTINDLEIGYAESVPIEGIHARLVLAHPEDACTKIDGPPSITTQDTMKWFAVIQRYPCPIQTKIKMALDAGFDGVIIYVSQSSLRRYDLPPSTTAKPTTRALKGLFDYVDPLFISPGSPLPIPALLVSTVDGTSMVNEYLYQKGFHVFISSNLPFDINAYLMPFAIIIGICIAIMQIFRCVRNHRRGNKHRLKKKYLKQIPVHKYCKQTDQFDTCAICLEDYSEGEKLRVLPCNHVYHLKCIDPWLTKNRKVCPVCKGKVILPGMSDESGSDTDTDGTEHSADERTPLIGVRSSEASSSNLRHYSGMTNHQLTRSGNNHLMRIDRSTQVNPMMGNRGSLLASVEAMITPILRAPEHSVNCDTESDASSQDSESPRPGERHQPGSSNRPSRHDMIV